MSKDLNGIKNESIDDIKNILKEVEEMYASFKDESSDEGKKLKSKLKDSIDHAKSKIEDFESEVKHKAKHAMKETCSFVQANQNCTMAAVGIAGVLVGLLAYRGCRK